MEEEKVQTEEQVETETPEYVPYSEYEALKKAQAGSDRAYHETKKKLDDVMDQMKELQKQSLTEKEKTELELKEREELIAKKERELEEASLRAKKTKMLAEKGLVGDWEYWEKINSATTDEEMQESLDGLIKRLEQSEKKVTVTGPPKSGDRKPARTANDIFREEYFRKKRSKV